MYYFYTFWGDKLRGKVLVIDSLVVSRHLISPLSEEIFSKKEHILLGISPFNSYFSEEMIGYWIKWAQKTFTSFNIFVPDTLPVHTFIALGYSEAKAKSKAKRQASYLKNKISRALLKLGFSTQDLNNLLIDMNFLEANESYNRLKEKCYSLYKDNLEFRNECDQCTGWVLNGHPAKELKEEHLNIAVRYILDEMPLFLNTPSILNKSSSIFSYHQTPQLLNYLYTNHMENEYVALNQGYLELSIRNPVEISNGVLMEEGHRY